MRNRATIAEDVAEHHRQTELILEIVRRDRSIDDYLRGHRISQILAAANARFMELHAEQRRADGAEAPCSPVSPGSSIRRGEADYLRVLG